MEEYSDAVAGVAFGGGGGGNTTFKTSLSGFIVRRRIEELSNNTEESLKMKVANFKKFSITLDESPDMSYTAQLAVFFPGIDMEFHVNEELADLMAMKGTTTDVDYMKSEVK